eukprot:TRINITY_DN554_c0_g1_i1.p1 TRINITY_DN554_c0_g1~~TRINITY_DN554_c0_g1_i1.p1  ORF type:complete len:734 (-),score=120.27 TRINITY_DN554_c0_g1_i1:680-2881(-)
MLHISLIASLALCLEGAVLPTFVFPEEEDLYFGQNVDQIKRDIGRALDNGCLDAWPLEDQTEIAVVFRHDSMVPETSDFYIQYQMEQVAADKAQDAAVGFRSLADHVQYKRKLAGALQVWEWSPHQMDFLKATMPGDIAKKLAYVPLSSSTDATDGCDAVLDEDWCQQDEPADVLFFGSMTESRKRLCNMVDEELDRLKSGGRTFSHQCVSGSFGEALKCKVCKAKIIYSDHSREGASLEVHRINPLLTQGKAVVSAKSADKFLDSLYQGAIELVDSQEIPKAISKLLLDDVRRMKLEWRSFALSQQLQRKAQSVLCQAFRSMANLATESLDSYDAWKRAGLQDYVPYVAERRMQTCLTGNCSNATNSTMPTPTPAPMTTLSKIQAAGVAALRSSEDVCQDSATVPAFNAAVAMQANVPAAAVSSNCSSTMVSPPSPSPSPTPSPSPPSPLPTPAPSSSPSAPGASPALPSNSSNATSGGRRLQAASYYMINMTYVVELTVYPNESNQTSIDLVNILTAMKTSDIQTEMVQQLANFNKTFDATQGTYLTVEALTPPQTATVTSVTSGTVSEIVSFQTTTMHPPTNECQADEFDLCDYKITTTPAPTPPPTPSPSAPPSPTPTPSPTPSPTPDAPPSPTPTPSAPPSPTPSPTPAPNPTPSAPLSPTPTAPTPSPVPAPTPTPSATPSPSAGPGTTPSPSAQPSAVDEQESGSIRVFQVFTPSTVVVVLASLLF